ncbi:hypothetical protein B0T17DRAFT_317560 [Bombardia bombarda]|uniref:Uncharacterized protein n=1 Tax=Bombardia bombarda TaxID=252184 RepID=A0AA39WM46_9PEZI|nr:hypothetical protein B0T17DRAFT_317560 [Bombardia bombarda]
MEGSDHEQFVATSLWSFSPLAIERIVKGLRTANRKHRAEVVYEPVNNWFKIMCHKDDQQVILRQFNRIVRKIEDDAFMNCPETMLHRNGTLKTSFETEWLNTEGCPWLASSLSPASLRNLCFPTDLSDFLAAGIWDALEHDSSGLTLPLLMDNEYELDKILNDTAVRISMDLEGRAVYIGAQNESCIDEAKQKLAVLLAFKKIKRPRTEHLLYAEGYVDKSRHQEYTVDTRYMANIDLRLVTSTLLDPESTPNLAKAYQKMYVEGVSVRLCKFDSSRGYHISFLGPKVLSRHKKRTILGNRPVHSHHFEIKYNLTVTHKPSKAVQLQAPDAFCSTQDSVEDLQQHALEQGIQVGEWIKGVPDLWCDSHVHPPTHAYGEDQVKAVAVRKAKMAGRNSDSKIPVADNYSAALISKAFPKMAQDPPLLAIDVETTASRPSITWNMSPLVPEIKHIIPNTAVDSGHTAAIETIDEPSILESAVFDEPLLVLTTPLIDVSQSEPTSTRVPQPTATASSKTAPSIADSPDHRKGCPNPKAKPFRTTTNQQGASRKDLVASTMAATASAGAGVPRPGPFGRGPQTRHTPNNFSEEVKVAVGSLIQSGPYRRGKITMRVELGRIILNATDESALAFNNAGTKSNGWTKDKLLYLFNQQVTDSKRVQFTKMLTTFAADVEEMISTRETPDGPQLWAPNPQRAWIEYSFRCFLRNADDETMVLWVSIKDGLVDENSRYELRRCETHYCSNVLASIYVHGLLRNWDMRTVFEHTDTNCLDEEFGGIARALISSLQVSAEQTGGLRLRFAPLEGKNFDALQGVEATVESVRVLTKWRHISSDGKSALEITEIQRTELNRAHDSGLMVARPWNPEEIKQRVAKGDFPRWYEASVVSTLMEDIFRQNEPLHVGEKATWTPGDILDYAVLESLFPPALKMLRKMDGIGATESNNQQILSGMRVRKANHPLKVPGAEPNYDGTDGNSAEFW